MATRIPSGGAFDARVFDPGETRARAAVASYLCDGTGDCFVS